MSLVEKLPPLPPNVYGFCATVGESERSVPSRALFLPDLSGAKIAPALGICPDGLYGRKVQVTLLPSNRLEVRDGTHGLLLCRTDALALYVVAFRRDLHSARPYMVGTVCARPYRTPPVQLRRRGDALTTPDGFRVGSAELVWAEDEAVFGLGVGL